MSRTALAYTIVGVPVSPLRFGVTTKAFEHNYSAEFQFDPATGKNLWETSYPLLNGEFEDQYSLDVVLTDVYSDDAPVLVGKIVGKADESRRFVACPPISDLEALLLTLPDDLRKAGIDPEGLNIYTVRYFS